MLPPSAHARGRLRRLSTAAVAVTLPLAATVVPFPTQAQPDRPTSPQTPSATHRVTLVTGDVVTVRTLADGRQIADVDRPIDAVGGVRVQENQGDLYVVPDEAVALLGAGRLDPQLFDVTGLIEMGYDDAGTGTVPVIATYTRAASRAPGAPAAPKGSRMVRELSAIRGAALSTPKPQARTFWTSVAPADSATDPTPTLRGGVARLWLDGRVTPQALEALVLGVHLLGVDRILIVPHTRCAMATHSEAELRRQVGESAGTDASWQQFGVIDDQLTALEEDVATVRSHPLIPARVLVGGFVYDVDTGLLQQIP